jgi:hypothetical protein
MPEVISGSTSACTVLLGLQLEDVDSDKAKMRPALNRVRKKGND